MKMIGQNGNFIKLSILLGGLYTTQMLAPAFMTNVTSLILRDAGESLQKISWLYTISMIWSANFIWAPIVDRFGSSRFGHYRSWVLVMQILLFIAVRLRVKKKVQNLNAMWYKEFAKNFATQGDFGHESP